VGEVDAAGVGWEVGDVEGDALAPAMAVGLAEAPATPVTTSFPVIEGCTGHQKR
jgi:hypothetical protein